MTRNFLTCSGFEETTVFSYYGEDPARMEPIKSECLLGQGVEGGT